MRCKHQSFRLFRESIFLVPDSDKVETIGGFVCELAGRVPLVGEKFSTETVLLEIERADSRQIHSILLTPVKNATP